MKLSERMNATIARKSDIIAKRDSTIAHLKQDKAAMRLQIANLKQENKKQDKIIIKALGAANRGKDANTIAELLENALAK